MDIFTAASALVGLSALLSYVNARFLRLPGTIGVVVLTLVLTIVMLVVGSISSGFTKFLFDLTERIDFTKTLLDVMLGFLLFAGALHVDLDELKQQFRAVLVLSTVGVLLSTALFGGGFFFLTHVFGINVPLIYCFLFGALISPTDPVAVGAIMKQAPIPSRLQTIITGESLFNDGVGLVLFISLQEVINPNVSFYFSDALLLFAREVFGGIALGLLMGYVAYRLIKASDDFQTVILLSLALVMILSVVASALHASVPLAEVTAGLLVSRRLRGKAGQEGPKVYLNRFWHLMDEILNTILFVMIGLQTVVLPFQSSFVVIGLMTAVLAIIARSLSIVLPFLLQFRLSRLNPGSLRILTWAGLRGGISVALALSLPDSPYRELILICSYCIVLFSIIGQGLTLTKLVNSVVNKAPRRAVN
ncbi:cation:proton antiporter [Spirosoma endophyticum]|uniref:Sodium/proton antiporter, CPA1 family n=1 Tax=Spirosoma endophyticum TaxID=662367 RepID=A0A1I1XUQ3_9BACT|nr:sodium:proton antiporter [Spirosoma endophyticum]SFE11034.1 sodium/proton antiporter, CPA1 family [Spirosoma endophyticum]